MNKNFPFSGVGSLKPALFFVTSMMLFAIHVRADSNKEVIDKAYNFVVQRDRLQALQLLTNSLKKNPQSKELLTALDEISNIFISDKAQQSYELGISLKNSDPAMAVTKMTEAAKLEPDNLAIQVEMIRLNILTNECARAEKMAKLAIEQNPYSEMLTLHLAQATICDGKLDQLMIPKATELRKSKLSIYWQLVNVDQLFRSGEFASALSLIKDLESKTSSKALLDPETSYWHWKLEDQLKVNNEKFAQKYLTDCRKLSSRQVRELSPDPVVCHHTVEVENFLKKSHNTGL